MATTLSIRPSGYVFTANAPMEVHGVLRDANGNAVANASNVNESILYPWISDSQWQVSGAPLTYDSSLTEYIHHDRPLGNVKVKLTYGGDANHLPCESGVVTIRVRLKMTAPKAPAKPRARRPFYITGRCLPIDPRFGATRMRLDRRRGSRWVKFGTQRVAGQAVDGLWFSYSTQKPYRLVKGRYRAYATHADPSHISSRSGTRTFVVR